MRDLHVVAVSEDGRHVLLGPSKGNGAKASHRVRLDARLVAAVRGELGTPAAELSPKEIQARLRAGESAEHIAAAAGMALTRVARFAGPVAGEMARMIDEARRAYVVRGRLGRSAVPLGEAVDAQLAEHAKDGSVVWSTRREEDGRWRVQLAWTARGRARQAAWWYEPHGKALESVDPASAALGHVDANPAPARRAAKPAAEPKPARKAAGPKQAASTPRAPKPRASKAATPPAPKRAAAPAKAGRAKAARPAVPAPKAPRVRLQVVPDPPKAKRTTPAKPTRRSAATAAEARDGVKGRASVPAWADVLLGTTPTTDR